MRAINSSVMKRMNRCLVLDCIRRKPISRAGIADETQLTRASVTQIVDELMRDGLVVEHSPISCNRPGRKQTQLVLVQDALCIAGVNLHCSGYDIGLINLGGEVIYSAAGEICDRPANEVLDEIAVRLKRAVSEIKPRKIYALGVTSPGPLDPVAGRISNPPCFPAWHNVPVAEMLRQRLGWDVYLGNVSNAFALDELYFGIGCDGVENFMVLRVDDCVSTGFVLEGELFNSKRGFAPEIGHISLKRDGQPCACGNRGCLEKYIAFPNVLEGTSFTSWNQVIDSRDTSAEAGELLNNVAGALAFEIINIMNVLYLDRVVLSGAYVYGGDVLADAVNRQVVGRSLHKLSEPPVLAGKEINITRIAAMPAYHTLFCG